MPAQAYLFTGLSNDKEGKPRQQTSPDQVGLGLDISIQRQLKCVLQGFPFFLWKKYIVPLFFSRLNRKLALSFVPLLLVIIQGLGT